MSTSDEAAIALLREWRNVTRNTPNQRSHKLTISASRHWHTVDRLLDHVDRLETIVRDLAASRINAATPERLVELRDRATEWVEANPDE